MNDSGITQKCVVHLCIKGSHTIKGTGNQLLHTFHWIYCIFHQDTVYFARLLGIFSRKSWAFHEVGQYSYLCYCSTAILATSSLFLQRFGQCCTFVLIPSECSWLQTLTGTMKLMEYRFVMIKELYSIWILFQYHPLRGRQQMDSTRGIWTPFCFHTQGGEAGKPVIKLSATGIVQQALWTFRHTITSAVPLSNPGAKHLQGPCVVLHSVLGTQPLASQCPQEHNLWKGWLCIHWCQVD